MRVLSNIRAFLLLRSVFTAVGRWICEKDIQHPTKGKSPEVVVQKSTLTLKSSPTSRLWKYDLEDVLKKGNVSFLNVSRLFAGEPYLRRTEKRNVTTYRSLLDNVNHARCLSRDNERRNSNRELKEVTLNQNKNCRINLRIAWIRPAFAVKKFLLLFQTLQGLRTHVSSLSFFTFSFSLQVMVLLQGQLAHYMKH